MLKQLLLALTLAAAAVQQPQTIQDLAKHALSQIDGSIRVPGLKADVQVVRDTWGVPHIYAQSTEDLFFAQGYVMAQDRLWQMEMWRRSNEGRLAEILGTPAVARDRQARLLKYRGALDETEFTSYHPDGRRIFESYVKGVNAFIAEANRTGKLPVEFVVTGIKPEPWTLETVLLRTSTFGDAATEIQLARSVAELGAEEANRRRNPDPFEELKVPAGLDVAAINADAANGMRAGGGALRPQILPQYASLVGGTGAADDGSVKEPGSNNWVVSGALSATGKPVVANDPHREVTLPSLRYISHLVAPGWNVVGASEPPFVGVHIGHSDRLAWGLTIVGTDQHDVYVEELNPANHDQVKWKGAWEAVRVVTEEISVKGQAAEKVELRFTRHGPVFFVDNEKHRAYVLRSAILQPGTAAYLGSLRLAQAKNCKEFLDAAMYWKAPTENLICGDVDGNIAWQASALTPSRKGWTGRLPVPGTGDYEWQGFRSDLPREFNPARGFVATANNNIQPKGYGPPIMFKNADIRYERITRLLQMIQPGKKYTLDDFQRMQHDAYSLRFPDDAALFKGWTAANADVEKARAMIAAWDGVYARNSVAAAMYEAWRTGDAAGGRGARGGGRGAAAPAGPPSRADVEARLQRAVERLTREQGADSTSWRWGRMHTRAFQHPFLAAFNLELVERAGGAGTVAADGATYREILDVSNWDRSWTINVPGQSGQPGSPYYSNLLKEWADNKYFPMVYSKSAVDGAAAHRLTLSAK